MLKIQAAAAAHQEFAMGKLPAEDDAGIIKTTGVVIDTEEAPFALFFSSRRGTLQPQLPFIPFARNKARHQSRK